MYKLVVGRFELVCTTWTISNLFEEAVARYKRAALCRGITLHTDVSDAVATMKLHGDHDRMLNALCNCAC